MMTYALERLHVPVSLEQASGSCAPEISGALPQVFRFYILVDNHSGTSACPETCSKDFSDSEVSEEELELLDYFVFTWHVGWRGSWFVLLRLRTTAIAVMFDRGRTATEA